MTLNLSARISGLTIDGQDFSSCIISTDGKDSHWDGTGLSISEWTIVLRPAGAPVSLDPRKARSFWRVGIPIILQTTNTSGALVRHPRGALRLLDATYDASDKVLTIQAGCLLRLLRYRQATNYQDAGIVPGTLTSRSTIVANLLTRVGITSYTVSGVPHPINYPLKIQGGYVQAIGKLLYDAGYVGWIDKNEQFQIKAINLNPSPVLTIRIGGRFGQEKLYQRVSGLEGPREIIKARTVADVAQPFALRNSFVRQRGDGAAVDPDLAGFEIDLKETTTIDSFPLGSTNRTQFRTFIRIRQPQGLLVPKGIQVGGASFLIDAEELTTNLYYESGEEGKLLKKVETFAYVSGAWMREFWAAKDPNNFETLSQRRLMQLPPSQTVTTEYFYNGDEVTRVLRTIRQSIGKILEGIDEVWTGYSSTEVSEDDIAEIDDQVWTEIRPGEYSYERRVQKPFCIINPDLIRQTSQTISVGGNPVTVPATTFREKLALVDDPNSSVPLNTSTTQNQPPATEHRPPLANFKQVEVEASVQMAQPGGNPFQEREKEAIEVQYPEGLANDNTAPVRTQLEKIARIEGTFLHGRFDGQTIQIALRDELFDWEPFIGVTCIEPDGTNRLFIGENWNWVQATTESLVQFDGVLIGDRGVSAIIQQEQAVTSGVPTTLNVQALPYAIPSGTVLSIGGINFTVTSPAAANATTIAATPASTGTLTPELTGTYTLPTLANAPAAEVPTMRGGIRVGGRMSLGDALSVPTMRGGVRVGGRMELS